MFVERAQRRIPVDYAKRQVGRRMMAAQTTHLPFKINMSGVIPPIFASSLLLFPATIAGFGGANNDSWWGNALQTFSATIGYGQPLHIAMYAFLIIFFCFFYTALVFNARETADNLKKSGAFIRGIRPGQQTGEYIDKVLTRLTLWGALYITAVCLLPEIMVVERRRAVRVRRHLAAHRRRGRHGFLLAADCAHAVAPVRQPHEARQSHGLRPQRRAAVIKEG